MIAGMSEPHGDDSALPPAAPEAAGTEGSAPDASSPLARPRRTLWQRVGGEGLALSVLIHILLILIAVVWVDRKSTRLNSSHVSESRMPSSA